MIIFFRIRDIEFCENVDFTLREETVTYIN